MDSSLCAVNCAVSAESSVLMCVCLSAGLNESRQQLPDGTSISVVQSTTIDPDDFVYESGDEEQDDNDNDNDAAAAAAVSEQYATPAATAASMLAAAAPADAVPATATTVITSDTPRERSLGGGGGGGAATESGPLLFNLDVDIGDGRVARIRVHDGVPPSRLATKFAMTHKLGLGVVPRLQRLIEQNMDLFYSRARARAVADLRRATGFFGCLFLFL